MKIRQGFVSNSSTTSFCIYGAEVTRRDYDEDGDMDIDEVADEHSLEYHYIDGDSIVGLSPDAMGDYETKLQFMTRVEKAIKKAFPNFNGAIEFMSGSYWC